MFDGQNIEFTQRLTELTESCEEAELHLIEAISASRELLGLRHGLVTTLIGDNDIGCLVGTVEADTLAPLSAALSEAADAKKAEAASKRVLTLTRAGTVPARRLQEKNEADAVKCEKLSEELKSLAEQLAVCCTSATQARGALSHHQASAVAGASVSTSGPCMTAFNDSITLNNMSVTKYWMGQFMGADCRLFAERRESILRPVQSKIAELFGEAQANKLFETHCGILGQLNIIGHHIRHVDMLLTAQIDELRVACAEYGIAYPDHVVLTPKGHLIEAHIIPFATYFGTIGVFGEDGMEAIHPMDTSARVLVRSMRNAIKRHQAMADIIQTEQQHRKPAGPKRRRRNKAQLELDMAAES